MAQIATTSREMSPVLQPAVFRAQHKTSDVFGGYATGFCFKISMGASKCGVGTLEPCRWGTAHWTFSCESLASCSLT